MGTVDFQQIAAGILTEQAGKLVQYLGSRLPKEVFTELNVKGSLKEKVYR